MGWWPRGLTNGQIAGQLGWAEKTGSRTTSPASWPSWRWPAGPRRRPIWPATPPPPRQYLIEMESVEVDGLRHHLRTRRHRPPACPPPRLRWRRPDTLATAARNLSDEFTVIAWDAPGAGQSSDPPESFGISGYADASPASSRSWVWPRRTWPAWSFGGILALALHGRHPAIPATLTLASRLRRLGRFPPPRWSPTVWNRRWSWRSCPRRVRGHLLPTMFSEGTPGGGRR